MSERICIDCDPEKKPYRPIHKDSGPRSPRCATHMREFKKGQKANNHGRMLQRVYNITTEEYWAIHASQGGKCFICQRATGERKKLAPDHDHTCCPAGGSCGLCIRALCCGPCNLGVLGHLRDDVDALLRAIEVIQTHPAQKVLRELRTKEAS